MFRNLLNSSDQPFSKPLEADPFVLLFRHRVKYGCLGLLITDAFGILTIVEPVILSRISSDFPNEAPGAGQGDILSRALVPRRDSLAGDFKSGIMWLTGTAHG